MPESLDDLSFQIRQRRLAASLNLPGQTIDQLQQVGVNLPPMQRQNFVAHLGSKFNEVMGKRVKVLWLDTTVGTLAASTVSGMAVRTGVRLALGAAGIQGLGLTMLGGALGGAALGAGKEYFKQKGEISRTNEYLMQRRADLHHRARFSYSKGEIAKAAVRGGITGTLGGAFGFGIAEAAQLAGIDLNQLATDKILKPLGLHPPHPLEDETIPVTHPGGHAGQPDVVEASANQPEDLDTSSAPAESYTEPLQPAGPGDNEFASNPASPTTATGASQPDAYISTLRPEPDSDLLLEPPAPALSESFPSPPAPTQIDFGPSGSHSLPWGGNQLQTGDTIDVSPDGRQLTITHLDGTSFVHANGNLPAGTLIKPDGGRSFYDGDALVYSGERQWRVVTQEWLRATTPAYTQALHPGPGGGAPPELPVLANPGATDSLHQPFHDTVFPDKAHVSGSAMDPKNPLTYRPDGMTTSQPWVLVKNGFKNILALDPSAHLDQDLDQGKLAERLQEALYYQSRGELTQKAHPDLYNLLHLCNGTASEYNNLITHDKATLKSLSDLGIFKTKKYG